MTGKQMKVLRVLFPNGIDPLMRQFLTGGWSSEFAQLSPHADRQAALEAAFFAWQSRGYLGPRALARLMAGDW